MPKEPVNQEQVEELLEKLSNANRTIEELSKQCDIYEREVKILKFELNSKK